MADHVYFDRLQFINHSTDVFARDISKSDSTEECIPDLIMKIPFVQVRYALHIELVHQPFEHPQILEPMFPLSVSEMQCRLNLNQPDAVRSLNTNISKFSGRQTEIPLMVWFLLRTEFFVFSQFFEPNR